MYAGAGRGITSHSTALQHSATKFMKQWLHFLKISLFSFAFPCITECNRGQCFIAASFDLPKQPQFGACLIAVSYTRYTAVKGPSPRLTNLELVFKNKLTIVYIVPLFPFLKNFETRRFVFLCKSVIARYFQYWNSTIIQQPAQYFLVSASLSVRACWQ